MLVRCDIQRLAFFSVSISTKVCASPVCFSLLLSFFSFSRFARASKEDVSVGTFCVMPNSGALVLFHSHGSERTERCEKVKGAKRGAGIAQCLLGCQSLVRLRARDRAQT